MLKKIYLPMAIAAHVFCAAEFWPINFFHFLVLIVLLLPWIMSKWNISKSFVDLSMPILVSITVFGVGSITSLVLAFSAVSLILVAYHLYCCHLEIRDGEAESLSWPALFIKRELAFLGAILGGSIFVAIAFLAINPTIGASWGIIFGVIILYAIFRKVEI